MELNEKLKSILGNDYTEEMTADDILAKLAEKNIADISKGDYVSVNKYNDAVSKVAKTETELKELRSSQMTAEEKAAQELADALREKDELIASAQKELNRAKVEKVFAGAGFAEDKISGFSDSISPETAETIIALMKESEENAVKLAKEAALKDFKSPEGGKGTVEKSLDKMTLDEIQALALKDPTRYNELKNLKK